MAAGWLTAVEIAERDPAAGMTKREARLGLGAGELGTRLADVWEGGGVSGPDGFRFGHDTITMAQAEKRFFR